MLGENRVPVTIFAEHIRYMRPLVATNRVGTFLYLGEKEPLMVEETTTQILERVPSA